MNLLRTLGNLVGVFTGSLGVPLTLGLAALIVLVIAVKGDL
jgi:hypothetical protein